MGLRHYRNLKPVSIICFFIRATTWNFVRLRIGSDHILLPQV